MFKFSIMTISLLLASFFDFFGGKMDPQKKNEKLMSGIIKTGIKQLSKRYGLIPIGIGGGEKDGKSTREYVAFHIHKKLTKEEARILIIEIVELFLHKINGSKEISHYLYDNPFTYKNLEFRVFIFDKDGSDVFHPDLGLVSLTPLGTISFVTYEPGTYANYASESEEPYEEAYSIATQKGQNTHL